MKCDGMQGCLVGGRPGDDCFINHAVVSEHGASSRGNILRRPLRVVGQDDCDDIFNCVDDDSILLVWSAWVAGEQLFLIEVLTQNS